MPNTIFEDQHGKIHIWHEECEVDPKKVTCNGRKASIVVKKDSDRWRFLEHEMDENHTSNQRTFATLTILTIITSALGWSVMYRINWDLGALVFPEPDYPYWVQSVFMIVLFSLLFGVFLMLTYKYYTKSGKHVDNLS